MPPFGDAVAERFDFDRVTVSVQDKIVAATSEALRALVDVEPPEVVYFDNFNNAVSADGSDAAKHMVWALKAVAIDHAPPRPGQTAVTGIHFLHGDTVYGFGLHMHRSRIDPARVVFMGARAVARLRLDVVDTVP